MTYALHFGVYPDVDGRSGWVSDLSVDGHEDRESEHLFSLDVGIRAAVSGSWAVWGPHDQEDGDYSLHVLVEFDHVPTEAEALATRHELWDVIDPDCRLLDHAVLSTSEDWAEQEAVYLFRGSPECVRFRVTR